MRSIVVVAFVLGATASCAPTSPSIVTVPDVAAPIGSHSSVANPPAGCTGAMIENTDVCDTPDARAAIAVCEAYRTAVEAHDVVALLELASQDYADDGGTPDPSDDVARPELETYLEHEFPHAQGIRLEIRYRKVESGALIRVRYTYSASFHVADVWRRKVDDSMLVLRRENGRLRIVSGM